MRGRPSTKAIAAAGAAVMAATLLAACTSDNHEAASPSDVASSSAPADSHMSGDSQATSTPQESDGGDTHTEESSAPDSHGDDHGDDAHGHDSGELGGLTNSAMGFTLTGVTKDYAANTPIDLQFGILAEQGGLVRDFDVAHEKKMHLMIVSHDLETYMHVHPEMTETGMWQVDLPGLPAGEYHMVTDFVPSAHPMSMSLGEDFTVGLTESGQPDTTESRVSTVDGYTAELIGDTAHEEKSALKVRITKDGVPITSVEPYLGASAHFVGFSTKDLGQFHTHANNDQVDADGTLTFTAPALGHDVYKGFVEANIDGEVRTFDFTWAGK